MVMVRSANRRIATTAMMTIRAVLTESSSNQVYGFLPRRRG
jgi:hypothetical protein